MPNQRKLIIANSVYQLLTAVHMRQTILQDYDVDLLITDITAALKDYLPRLNETKLFKRVIFGNIKELNRKYIIEKEAEISEGFENVSRLLKWILSEELSIYSEIYFANFDIFTRMLACYFYRLSCDFICYEDGFSSYVIDYLRQDRTPLNLHPEASKIKDKVKMVLLYEPQLAIRGDRLPNRALPKIKRDNEQLKEVLNYIFNYKRTQRYADFIFLEQSFRAEGLKTNDLALISECQHTVGSSRFIVKPHPRNPENIPFQLGLTRRYSENIPWELFLLNEDPKNLTMITVCSNAALTGRIVFGIDMNTIMLYQLFEGKVLWKEDEILKRYLRKFRRQFAGSNYYVPETIYELRSILKYLGGHDEQ